MSLELKDLGLTFGSQFTPQVLTDLYSNYMEKIEMKPNKTLIDEELLRLPRVLSNTYHLWKSGANMLESLNKPTFYRHRKQLLEFGVDIKIPPVDVDVPNNVIPMMRVIEAAPVNNPKWAYDQGLIAV
jgi:II/X family phage/plasmid replication protein